MQQNQQFSSHLHRYAHALLLHSLHMTACTGLHSLEQRCARWFLTALDRVSEDRLAITHELLGDPSRRRPPVGERRDRRFSEARNPEARTRTGIDHPSRVTPGCVVRVLRRDPAQLRSSSSLRLRAAGHGWRRRRQKKLLGLSSGRLSGPEWFLYTRPLNPIPSGWCRCRFHIEQSYSSQKTTRARPDMLPTPHAALPRRPPQTSQPPGRL